MCQPPNKQLERTVIRRRCTAQRAAAELRRHATKRNAPLTLLLLAGLVSVSQRSHAQGCEWEGLPVPPSDVEVIEVHRYGGYGPPAGRTLVRIDSSDQTVWVPHGRCPDRALAGRLATFSFDDLEGEFRRAVESNRSQPPRSFVSDENPISEIIREGRIEPLCRSPEDGVDLDVTFYSDGMKEHYGCVTGALLRFAADVLRTVPDAICAIRPVGECAERVVGEP